MVHQESIRERSWSQILPKHDPQITQPSPTARKMLTSMPPSHPSVVDPARWTGSLRAVLHIVLDSKQPTFLAMGPERLCVYNDAFVPIMGRKHPEMFGRPSSETWAEAWGELEPMFDRVFGGEAVHMSEFDLGPSQGLIENANFDFSCTPIKADDGSVVGLFGVCFEATDRATPESKHLASAERERSRLSEMARDLFAVATFDGHLRSINPAWSRLLGRSEEELTTRPFAEIIHPDDLATTGAVLDRLRSGEPVHQFHVRLLKADGTPVSFAWSAVPETEGDAGTFYTVGRDITDDVVRDEALRQSQKMDAVGQLTGGLAHDFNNLLMAVLANLELLAKHLLPDQRSARLIEGAVKGAQRGAALTQRLLAFARRQDLIVKPTNLGELLEGMGELLERSLGDAIEVRFSKTKQPPRGNGGREPVGTRRPQSRAEFP